MKSKLENYASTHGVSYVNNTGKSSTGVSCPEGFLDLPFDIWKCKLDRQTCKLQAWISLDNEDQFKAGCHAPDQRKENIYRVIQEGIYKGAHHKPGRFLCPTCQGKPNNRYYYSWELTSLGQFVDTSNQDLTVTLVKNNIDMSVTFSNLCSNCFIQVISIIKPDLAHELETIQITFTNDPFQTSASESLGSLGKKPDRDFVSLYLETSDSDQESPPKSWLLGLALADIFDQEEIAHDYGDALALASDWLGLTDEEVDDICIDEDESRLIQLHETANSVAWRAGWAVLCGGLDKLLKRD